MAYDNERLFAERLANVFLQDHRVKVTNNPSAIACCDVVKKDIMFNFPEIFPEFSDNDKIFQQMMVFKGLTFHEILHLKFTSKKRGYTTNLLFMRLLGQLEDGRIETLGVMMHEKLADYFICAVNDVLLKDKTAIVKNKDHWLLYAYILCFGRSIYFQDTELLALMREMIIKTYGAETAVMVEDTVKAFIPEPKFDERIRIATVLFDHLLAKGIMPKYDMSKKQDIFVDSRSDDNEKNMDKDMKDLAKDFPELSKVMEKINDAIKQMTKDVKDNGDAMEKAKQDKANKLKDLSEKRQKIYQKVYDEKDAEKRNDLRQKVDELSEQIKDTMSGTGFSPDGMEDLQDKLKDKIKGKKDEQEKLVEAHKDDLTSDLKSIGHEVDEVYADSSFTVTDEMKTLAKDLERSLAKMNNELAKGYQPKNKSGRLNVRALLNRKNQMDFKVFNRYTPDKLRLTKALVNIYVDGSGSMGGGDGSNWAKAIKTMWIVNDALNRDENKVMIYQFSSGYKLVKEYDKILTVPKMIGGGTYPASAIQHSIPIIEAYKKAKNFNFVVDVIITDGEFDCDSANDNMIQALNNLGHETILIRVGGNAGNPAITHKAKHSLGLVNFNDLVGSMTKIFVDIKKGLVAQAKVM